MTREEKEQWDIFMNMWIIPALKNTWGEEKCKEIVEALNEWEEQEPCDNCEVGNPCLYYKHEFESQERSE